MSLDTSHLNNYSLDIVGGAKLNIPLDLMALTQLNLQQGLIAGLFIQHKR